MKSTPLQLEDFVFPKVSVEAVEAKEGEPLPSLALEAVPEYHGHGTDPNRFLLVLRVRCVFPWSGKGHHEIEVVVHGRFAVVAGTPDRERDMSLTNGAVGILFGAVRELVAQLTGRGPLPRIVLPAISFPPGQLDVGERIEAPPVVEPVKRPRRKTATL